MPCRCSMFGCRSNYDNETVKVPIFSLPKNSEKRQKWIRAIPTDLSKLKHPIVCIKHFQETDIIREDRLFYKGEFKVYPRLRPKLTDNAVPSIFQYVPQSNIRKKRIYTVQVQYTANQCSHIKNTEIPNCGNSKDFEKKLSVVSIRPCCIENCKSHLKTGTNMVFHKFPLNDEELTRRWVKNICQKNFVPTVHHVICSNHFNADCYLNGYACANQLKTDAIPTVFDFPIKRQKLLKQPNTFSTAMVTAEDITLNEINPIFKDEEDSETNTDIEELFSLENGSEDSQEVLKQKLKKLTACYKKSQTKMKEYQQQCKLYVKEVTELKEIINNLKEIISVTEGNYFQAAS